MLREYPCPTCGYSINSWAQLTRCPRCDAMLPKHEVDIPLPASQETVVEREVDYFQRRGAALQPDEEIHERVPWFAQPAVLVALAAILALLLLGVAIWLVLDGDLGT